jgi:glutaminyl-peptide cyclotransferase
MPRLSLQTAYLVIVLAASGLLVGWLVWPEAQAGSRDWKLQEIPFDGGRAFEYLTACCDFGPRPSGSKALAEQRQWMVEHFEKCGGEVSQQTFRVRHPLTGAAVSLANVIARWHPDRPARVLLCAHYDTRPFPDRDPRQPKGRFVGANDGGSGVAVLMELAHRLPALPGTLGVDIVLFDGEELVYDEVGEYFLGSTFFARQYAAKPPAAPYRWGVLLDMVGDNQLRILQEVNGLRWEETRPLIASIWGVAKRLQVREFIPRAGHEVRDDHLPLHDIAGIPTCDIIDFDYDYWHTEQDVPRHCSPLSLAKVGWVIEEWLKAESSAAAPAQVKPRPTAKKRRAARPR